jgi:hypothetical protein
MKFAKSSLSEAFIELPVAEALRAAALGPPVWKLRPAILFSFI